MAKLNTGSITSFESLLLNNKNAATHPQLADKIGQYMIAVADGYIPSAAIISALLVLSPAGPAASAHTALMVQLHASGIINASPVLGAVASAIYNDTVGDDNFTAVSGTLLGSDPDNDALTYGISGGSADGSLFDYDVSKSSAFGTLYLNSSTGVYTFVPNDGAIEALNTSTSIDFIFNVSDGTLSDSKTFTVTLNGVVDGSIIMGDDGPNTLIGGSGNDTIIALGGDDNLQGLGGDDFLDGGDGQDTLVGGLGADTINAGGGNDQIVATNDNVRDILDGETGFDSANYSAYTTGLTVTLNGSSPVVVFGSGSTEATSDTIVNIENFTGGSGNDTITAGSENDQLIGNDGDDVLHAGSVFAFMHGGEGDDTFYADTGNAYILVGPGSDVAYGNGNNNNWLAFQIAQHSVVVDFSLASGQVVDDGFGYTDSAYQFHNVNGSPHNDSLRGGSGYDELRGFEGDDVIYGGGGGDLLIGEKWYAGTVAGNDRIFGEDGDDTLIGDYNNSTNPVPPGGNDYLDGGTGNDYLQGGPGNDIFVFSQGYGNDIIADFEIGDRVDIRNFGLTNIVDVQLIGIQAGNNTLLTFADGSSLTMSNVVLANLTNTDFIF